MSNRKKYKKDNGDIIYCRTVKRDRYTQ